MISEVSLVCNNPKQFFVSLVKPPQTFVFKINQSVYLIGQKSAVTELSIRVQDGRFRLGNSSDPWGGVVGIIKLL